MFQWDEDLKIAGCELYLDSRQPRAKCFISHAHSDHLGTHQLAIATPQTARLSEHRIGEQATLELSYDTTHALDADTQITLKPAGHVLGSAMLHVRRSDGASLLYTGDFKLRKCLTVECAEPVQADELIMESTYGQPFFRFPKSELVRDELVQRVSEALRENRQPIVMGYTLGKAQEATKLLLDAKLPVTLHGAVWNVHNLYEQLGVPLGPVRRYRWADFHGSDQLDLRERGVLVAPPYVARSAFVTSFDKPLSILLSGWGMLKNAQYRYGVDHVLPLSDHADFDELLELIELVRPKKIFTHHGYREFAEILCARGLDAACAEPDRQLSLFDR